VLRFLPAVVAVFATVVPAAAQDAPVGTGAGELIADVDTIVEIEPVAGTMVVSNHYRFVNPTIDDGFTGFFEVLPWDATEVIAESGGVTLTAVGLPARDGFAEWLVSFPAPLAPGRELAVTLSWRQDGLDSGPDDFGLVSRDLVSVAPYAARHEGRSTLTVRVDGSFDVVVAAGFEVQRDDERLTFTIDEAAGYSTVPIVLEAPDRFVRNRVDAGGVEITVATANGPSSWLAADLDALVTALASWIPLAPPPGLEFRQGYTGGEPSRVDGDGTIVLPFDPDPVVAVRIVADAWLSAVEFVDPDLRSAFSGAVADRVAVTADLPLSARAGVWVTAFDALVSVSDAATVTTVLAALDAGVPAYAGVDDEFVGDAVGWRRVTDVFEHIGGVTATTAAMRLSLTEQEWAELDRREVALTDYRALEVRAAPWAMPPLLRDPMAVWDFDTMAADQASVSDLIVARDEMMAAADVVGLSVGGFVQAEFEAAELSMDRAWELHVEQRETLEVVAEALRLEEGDRGLLSSLGLWGSDVEGARADLLAAWDSGDYEVAAWLAQTLIDDFESSVGRGTLRLVLPIAVGMAVVVALQALWARRRRARRAQAGPE